MDASPIAAEVAALQSIKGCAFALAAAFSAEVGDFTRFRSGRQVTAYFGLAPSQRSSGDSVRLGGISGAGNALVRKLAVEGSWCYAAARHQPKLMPRDTGVPLEIRMHGRKGSERLLRRREEMLAFWRLVEVGVIPRHVTHNDTKISNILFDRAGNVLCVIDLDTVMNSTSLNDFGDAIRTYTNTGAEDDRDLRRVGMSMELFTAYTEGYLSQHARELSPSEREYLAFSARYITYEQVLRFLMDYLDGDTYYKTRSADHNLVRTRAQYRLLQSMEEQYDAMCDVVRRLADRYATTKH